MNIPKSYERRLTMTREEKSLLLKDLSARLPYHVKVKVWLKDGTTEEGALDLEHNYANVLLDAFYYNKIKEIKPYLRLMSSMTDEEKKIFLGIRGRSSRNTISAFVPNGTIDAEYKVDCIVCSLHNYSRNIDWLNKNHFDYRGLIPMGLALDAPEGMYK